MLLLSFESCVNDKDKWTANVPERAMNDHTDRFLAIYLNDHLAALVAARELARRTSSRASGEETRALAGELVAHFADGEVEVERLLGAIGARRSRVKRALASVAEKGGRVKPNGQLKSRSPLSDLVELEGLTLLLEYEAGLWRSLESAKDGLAGEDRDFAARERRASEWQTRLAAHGGEVARRSLADRPTGE